MRIKTIKAENFCHGSRRPVGFRLLFATEGDENERRILRYWEFVFNAEQPAQAPRLQRYAEVETCCASLLSGSWQTDKYITSIAGRTVPILEDLLKWDTASIRTFFESHGFALTEWDKIRTDAIAFSGAASETGRVVQ